ncbi:acyl-CoA dehydrogenase family protein [Nocardia sp. NPDC005825]|uniref:acyl-CoA dehydrogenase family protein n=1 Tax=unclassified Nocardia TaxID=2637762 RepID=UPI0033CAAFBD
MAIRLDELAALRAAVRDLLAARCDEAQVRRVMAEAEGFDRDLWAELAGIGVTGMLIGDEDCGTGLGPVEVETVAEETGAALLPAPFLGSAVLATALIQAAGTVEDRRRLLPGLAAGTSIATVALTGPRGSWTPAGVAVRAAQDDTLTGRADFVLFGQAADVILVVAQTADGIGIFEMDSGARGFERTAASVFDPTVRLSTFVFDAAPARRLGTEGWGAVQTALDLALVALAGEQVGGTRRIFDTTVEYLKTRIQFGRQIGSFQALKHAAADLLTGVESATSAARNAATTLQSARADGAVDIAVCGAVDLAGFVCAETFEAAAMQAIQLHGGIGFTWEHPAHLYARRARSAQQLFGGSRLHRERYLESKGA